MRKICQERCDDILTRWVKYYLLKQTIDTSVKNLTNSEYKTGRILIQILILLMQIIGVPVTGRQERYIRKFCQT